MRPLIVAAPSSGCGKTSLTLGLLGVLQRRGLTVAPFKVGPDFIDPGHHAALCGRTSRNLDGWMCDRDQVVRTYAAGCRDAEVAVVEGVMGLFDGASGASDTGSTAEICRWLDGRILLVVDARSQARSAVALVKGFVEFAADLDFAGIVFNRVGSANHAALLQEAMASVPGLPPLLGLLPRQEGPGLSERHLGLVTAAEADWRAQYSQLTDWVSENLDLDRLLNSLGLDPVAAVTSETPPGRVAAGAPVRIGVARDQAFCFYYPENLELLERAGAELVFFSPLTAETLPENLDGLYLGGGYPELYAEQMAANRALLVDIRNAADRGLPIYAECGGLMTLADALDGHPMTGVLPAQARMLSRRKALGYREVTFTRETLLGPVGTRVRGHEFHYSELSVPETLARAYRVTDRKGTVREAEGYLKGNVLGSYVHLHFGSNPKVAENFVRYCWTVKRTTLSVSSGLAGVEGGNNIGNSD